MKLAPAGNGFFLQIFLVFISYFLFSSGFAQTSCLQMTDTVEYIANIDSSVINSDNLDETENNSSQKVLFGTASFYANKFNGRRTASGEIFSQLKLTCACNKLPLGTWIKVTNIRNGKSIVVKVNDRIHPKVRRLVDLTRFGAKQLGYISSGLTKVKVEVLPKQKHH